jgi:hypothetical protein
LAVDHFQAKAIGDVQRLRQTAGAHHGEQGAPRAALIRQRPVIVDDPLFRQFAERVDFFGDRAGYGARAPPVNLERLQKDLRSGQTERHVRGGHVPFPEHALHQPAGFRRRRVPHRFGVPDPHRPALPLGIHQLDAVGAEIDAEHCAH